jgi:hypothetical protein
MDRRKNSCEIVKGKRESLWLSLFYGKMFMKKRFIGIF